MTNLRDFKQGLARVSRMWDAKAFDQALSEVEEMLDRWPGNSHLHVLFSRLVQLQDETAHTLEKAKVAIRQAIELERDAPAASIELGHYLDNVEDDPKAAARAFANGVAVARELLIEGLTGQAKALIQSGDRKQALRCLTQALQLDRTLANGEAKKRSLGELIDSDEIRELLSEAASQPTR